MLPPYRHAGSDVVLWTLVGIAVAGEYVGRFRSQVSRTRSASNRQGPPAETWSLLVVMVAIIGGVVAADHLAAWQKTEIVAGCWPVFGLGLALIVIGTSIRQWSIATLGKFFTGVVRLHQGQTVVDGGPYKFLRHPSYTGMIVFFVGLGLALTNWASLLVLAVVPTAGLVVRIFSEERVLLAGLGEPYRQFAASRRRLFPGIW